MDESFEDCMYRLFKTKTVNRLDLFEVLYNDQQFKIDHLKKSTAARVLINLESEIDKLKEDNRMKLAAISVMSLCNTVESISKQSIDKDNFYWTAALDDTRAAVEREIKLIEENKKLRECVGSTSKNSCCDKCQEAKLVAKSCLLNIDKD